ncbi:hypothetical protein VTO73DRAFT_9092 [Trametes versicolor]
MPSNTDAIGRNQPLDAVQEPIRIPEEEEAEINNAQNEASISDDFDTWFHRKVYERFLPENPSVLQSPRSAAGCSVLMCLIASIVSAKFGVLFVPETHPDAVFVARHAETAAAAGSVVIGNLIGNHWYERYRMALANGQTPALRPAREAGRLALVWMVTHSLICGPVAALSLGAGMLRVARMGTPMRHKTLEIFGLAMRGVGTMAFIVLCSFGGTVLLWYKHRCLSRVRAAHAVAAT